MKNIALSKETTTAQNKYILYIIYQKLCIDQNDISNLTLFFIRQYIYIDIYIYIEKTDNLLAVIIL